jgi:hypothetical protein
VFQDGTNEIISRLMSLSARSGAPSRPTHSPPPLEGGTSSAARARCQHTLCPRSAVQSCDAAACKSWPKPSTVPSVLLMQSLIESNRRRASGSGAARGCYARTPDAARASRFTDFHSFPLVWFQVLISLSSQSSLHLSFTVLFRYRSPFNI